MRPLILALLLGACVPKAAPLDASADAGEEDAAMDAAPIDATPDAGESAEDSGAIVEDGGGFEDASPPDTGVPSHCPVDVNPACTSASACGTDVPPPSNCASCVVTNAALCVDAACETPPLLDLADIYAIATQVDPTVPLLESIAAFAIAARTAGERIITCADVYAGTIDWSDRCYNVLESKSSNVSQTGDTYTVSFNGFTSGQRTLFVLYGHRDVGARGDPVGVSCTEIDVGPPMGGMSMFFAGDRMRPL